MVSSKAVSSKAALLLLGPFLLKFRRRKMSTLSQPWGLVDHGCQLQFTFSDLDCGPLVGGKENCKCVLISHLCCLVLLFDFKVLSGTSWVSTSTVYVHIY